MDANTTQKVIHAYTSFYWMLWKDKCDSRTSKTASQRGLVSNPNDFEQGVDLNGDGVADAETTLESGMKIQKIDINGDGQVDVINHYKEREDGTQVLMYKSVDMNWDGKDRCTNLV